MPVKRTGGPEFDVDDLVPPSSFAASDADGTGLLRLPKLLNEGVHRHHRGEGRIVRTGARTRRTGLVTVEQVRKQSLRVGKTSRHCLFRRDAGFQISV
jgi:hypothetical protein